MSIKDRFLAKRQELQTRNANLQKCFIHISAWHLRVLLKELGDPKLNSYRKLLGFKVLVYKNMEICTIIEEQEPKWCECHKWNR